MADEESKIGETPENPADPAKEGAASHRMVLTEEMLLEAPEAEQATAEPEVSAADDPAEDKGESGGDSGSVSPPVDAKAAETAAEPEPAPSDSVDQAEPAQPEAASVQASSGQVPSEQGQMLDVDVLFGVMQQVSSEVTSRIAEMLPGMLEEALNRHLSGLKSDRQNQNQ